MSNKAGPSRSARLLNPAPEEVRDLVLDYLIHNCYTSATRAFVRESGVKHVDADGDEVMTSPVKESSEAVDTLEERLAMGELRKEIRMHILTGRIDEATALLNTYFPSVLSENVDDVNATSASGKLEYLPSTSVNPAHLALNLRIQAFIEAARTKPLLYYPPGSKTPLPHPPLLSGSAKHAESSEDEDADMSEPSEEATAQLLHRAQSLYSETNQLTRPEDRAQYLHELGKVGGLLAYPKPEGSPLDEYMRQHRREGVADQIDGAILYRAKRPTISRIELYTRYTATVWGMLHDQGITVPPRSAWPAGVSLPPRSPSSQDTKPAPVKDSGSLENAIPITKKPGQEKEAEEVLPPFDLHLFVEAQECR
ncbi:CTLH/CRA C-terminal to lish motif domain-containing protein [Earliella scabrosa]|nr:CTLH/CRA C-terminal to lish motif domain-containing protein [Earliella scabrosa]